MRGSSRYCLMRAVYAVSLDCWARAAGAAARAMAAISVPARWRTRSVREGIVSPSGGIRGRLLAGAPRGFLALATHELAQTFGGLGKSARGSPRRSSMGCPEAAPCRILQRETMSRFDLRAQDAAHVSQPCG